LQSNEGILLVWIIKAFPGKLFKIYYKFESEFYFSKTKFL